jgi:hypothetical protein
MLVWLSWMIHILLGVERLSPRQLLPTDRGYLRTCSPGYLPLRISFGKNGHNIELRYAVLDINRLHLKGTGENLAIATVVATCKIKQICTGGDVHVYHSCS